MKGSAKDSLRRGVPVRRTAPPTVRLVRRGSEPARASIAAPERRRVPPREPADRASGSFWQRIGGVVNFLGWRLAALRAYEAAVQKHPTSAAAHYRLGEMLAKGAQWRRAARAFADAVRLKPANAEYHGNLVLALWKAGQYDTALAALERLLFLQPQAGELHLLHGTLLAKRGDKPRAVRALRTASTLPPSPHDPRCLLAEALLGADDWAAALEAWRVATTPRGRGRKSLPRRAIERIARLRDAWLPSGDIATLKGVLLLRMGHRRRALRSLERAATPRARAGGHSPILKGLLWAAGFQASHTAVSVLARSAAARQQTRCRVVMGPAVAPARPLPRRRSAVPAATLLAFAALGGLFWELARRGSVASAAADGARAQVLVEACLAERGSSAADVCRKALAVPLSPQRALLVRRALARALDARGGDETAALAAGSGAPASGRP